MLLFNILTTIFCNINEFIYTTLIPLFSNYVFEGLVIITIIHLAYGYKATRVLDVI
jgi:hypothetical protein